MRQISARFVSLACLLQVFGCANASSKPKPPPSLPGSIYELQIEREFLDTGAKITNVIVRNGDRELIESKTEFFGELARKRLAAGGPSTMLSSTFYDFAAHKVYWSGLGQNALPGGCAWGHYLSKRAPVEEDLVTGTTDALLKMAEGRQQRTAGASVVNRLSARLVEFIGGTKPKASEMAAVWPVRVFLADDSGIMLKAEATDANGKPTTLFEVTRLTLGATRHAALLPPERCTFGNSEMDDTGLIRAHVEANARVEASGSLDAASGSSSSEVNVTSSGGQ